MKKQIIINIHTSSGEFINTWTDATFEAFQKEINGGPGECVIRLGKEFDYGERDLKEGNEVEIRISDKDTVADITEGTKSRIIYRGYMSMIEREANGNGEGITVHLLGYYTLLALDFLKNGAQTTLYTDVAAGLAVAAPSNNADIGLVMRAIIDRYRAETSNPRISYDSADIPDTGTVGSYSFERMTYREAMDKAKEMSPIGNFYYVDERGLVKFGAKPSTPTHKFIFGRHFAKINLQRSIEKIRNFLLLWNGETGAGVVYKHYQDDESIALYGRRAHATNDYGIDNVAAADLIGDKFINESKDPEAKVICEILDNNGDDDMGYDIESIQPGDTCSFYGFDPFLAEIFKDNMLITKVRYSLDKAVIEVEITKSGLIDFQEIQRRKIAELSAGGLSIPVTYT